jgi:alkylation response protein AidB-like acyl-CoA dehydrogenase
MAETSEARVRARLDQLLAEPVGEAAAFLGRQFDLGLGWVRFPEGHGGMALDPGLQPIVDMALAEAGAPAPMSVNPIGVGMAAPTLLAYGTPDHLGRFLRPLFTGAEPWCQLFSEPGAGSDVAGLATSAVRDGADWVINGQKVWTSLGHLARWGLLLARTDPGVPKHRGLTYFVVDMHAPGVEVRPLTQMTGDAEFNEVYFTEVRIPDGMRLGEVGGGWRVALATLMNERVFIGGTVPPRGGGPIGAALSAWTGYGHTDRARREELVEWWVRAEVLRLTNIRAAQAGSAGTPGPEGSIGKLMSAELNKDIWSFVVDLMGMDGTLYPAGYTRPDRATPQFQFARSPANSIEGGTTDIMRNILGERVLGLPGDVRVDKDVPWSRVPRA